MTESNKTPIAGWGRFPVRDCVVHRPASWAALQETVAKSQRVISRGLGRSYGDSALNADGVIDHTALDRILDFDPEAGILECEAGLSLGEIIRFIHPKGWFLPTSPGTKFVTVGGAVAADIHGKNHHSDGSFGDHVVHLDLLVASGEVVRCSPTERADLFDATLGGMGLTGVIMSVRFRLTPVKTAYYDARYIRTKGLDESLRTFEETNAEYRYSVAWVDCLASGASLGRSVVMLGNDCEVDRLPEKLRERPLEPKRKMKLAVPFDAPGFALNPLSVKAFNELYYRVNKSADKVVDFDSWWYPLDAINHWNRIYGKRGFVQFQALLPEGESQKGLVALLERIAKEKQASFLAVLKSSGARGRGWLSYLYPGHTLALDFPNFGPGLIPFMNELDRILLDHGGRLYLAKDATTSKDTFRKMYPEMDRFLALKADVDPSGKFSSEQARRVGLVNAS